MASNVKYSTALKNARLNQITTTIGAGGILRIYDGTQPAGPDTAITTQTLLIEFACDAAAFAGAASGGVLTANSIGSANGLASSTATWGRLLTNGGVAVADGSVGTSNADWIIDNDVVVLGQNFNVTSLTFTSAN